MIRDDGMMDPIAKAAHDPLGPANDEGKPGPKPRKNAALDGPKGQKLLRRLLEWYDQEWDRQAANRFQMAIDEDYYDGMQWTQEDSDALLERGQAPFVYNEVKPALDWIIGTERRTRIDYKVMPRRKEQHQEAETKTQVLKYLSDVNHSQMHRSRAFASSAKAGLGWIEIAVRGDDDEEPIYQRYESWRNVLHDSNAIELDLSDARYVFRWRYVDLDLAEAYFPTRKSVLRASAITGTVDDADEESYYLGARMTDPNEDYATPGRYRPFDSAPYGNSRRQRVKLFECWYRDAKTAQVDSGRGDASTVARSEMQVKVAIYAKAGLLYAEDSPYDHNKFPLVPLWCFRRARDNAPYGMIRNSRDAQDGVNKRASKAVWILSSNRVLLEDGAVDDIEELRDEVARPDAVVVYRHGKKLEIDRDNQLAAQHVEMMANDRAMIRMTSGVTDENLGRETNATSGKAILARQDQGSVVTTEIFDNLRFAIQLAGEIELSLVEQYMGKERVIRLVGDRGNPEFVEINQPDPETGRVLNSITANKADFIVSQQDYRDSLRIAMFESLMDITGRLAQMAPEIAFKLLDLVVEMADIPNRDEIVSRIRQLNGMRDPDAEPTPEEQMQLEAQAQEQAAQKQMQDAMMQAQVQDAGSKAAKSEADAMGARLGVMRSAAETAQMIASAPGSAPMADELMRSAGYSE